MIYCVNEPGWSIVVESMFSEVYIKLRVGDKLYADEDTLVTLAHLQSDFKGETSWYWRRIDMSKSYEGQTMFTHESYSKFKTNYSGSRASKCNLKNLIGKGVVTDITKSVDREIKLKQLGV